jgi:hypothetical protein
MTMSGVLPGANVELRQAGYEPAEWHKAVRRDPRQRPHATPFHNVGQMLLHAPAVALEVAEAFL